MQKPVYDLCAICGKEATLIYELNPNIKKLTSKYPRGDFILAVASFATKKSIDGVIKHTCHACLSKMPKK